jgi:Caspase domain
MAKVALLVGVSGCEIELPTLQRSRINVEVLKRALQIAKSGFEVVTLCDYAFPEMIELIERFFRQRDSEDQIMFLFSGYGIRDTDGQLYLTTPATKLDTWGHLVRSRTLPMQFLQNMMDSSPASQQMILLDCCFRLTNGIAPSEPEHSMEDVLDRLIGPRRVILSATTTTQHEPEPDSLDAWSYTRYIAEGAATGAADNDCDGSLTVKELHWYAHRKLQIAAPAQHPQFYGSEDTANQMVLQVPTQTPVVRYRQFLEKLAQTSEIDKTDLRVLSGRNELNALRQHLGLSSQEAIDIEMQVLRPIREHQVRVQLYQKIVSKLNQETGA